MRRTSAESPPCALGGCLRRAGNAEGGMRGVRAKGSVSSWVTPPMPGCPALPPPACSDGADVGASGGRAGASGAPPAAASERGNASAGFVPAAASAPDAAGSGASTPAAGRAAGRLTLRMCVQLGGPPHVAGGHLPRAGGHGLCDGHARRRVGRHGVRASGHRHPHAGGREHLQRLLRLREGCGLRSRTTWTPATRCWCTTT